jgi:hypothetical protein
MFNDIDLQDNIIKIISLKPIDMGSITLNLLIPGIINIRIFE